MKSILIAGLFVFILIALVLYFTVDITADDGIFEEDWGTGDDYVAGMVNGTWGTKIEILYEDGSTEVLGSISPIFGVSYQDKKVESFEYLLQTKIEDDRYDMVEFDWSNFEVLVMISGYEDEDWYETSGSVDTANTDGEWNLVYNVIVSASELDRLEVGRSYNLTFTPSGFIGYRTSSSGEWIFAPLPIYFYVNFQVKSDYVPDDPYDPDPPDDEKWIEVVIGSGTET